MASKGTLKSNILESIETLGRDTAKGSLDALKKTFNPLELIGKAAGLETKTSDPKEKTKNRKNHTELDFEQLQKQYDNNDKSKLDAYRQKLFQLVKSGEEKAITEDKQEKQQQAKQETINQKQQEEQKKKRINAQSQTGPIGKLRKNILGGGKRKANVQLEQSVEYKQNAGK